MITITLSIRYGSRPVREACAWYLADSDPVIWIREIVSWNIPQQNIRLFPIPRSIKDRNPRGILVTVPESTLPKITKRWVPFGKIAGRLFLPIEAQLSPCPSDPELVSLLSAEKTYVWHPAFGVTAFESHEILTLADLFCFQPATPTLWNAAQRGTVLAPRLLSLKGENRLSIQDVLAAARDGIGTEKDSLSELPRSPKEETTGIFDDLTPLTLQWFARGIQWLASHAPANSPTETWINRLENWAQNQLQHFPSKLEKVRNKELHRLLHLLQTNPEEGLRYALPLRGDGHRGKATPTDRLEKREVNFDLNRLGGGRAADHWGVESQLENQLMARYRELANREIGLGHHRRAAYIFAELLADFNAAAETLTDGHHWREAATLYLDRLNLPRQAAHCLHQGGFWIEAIEQYRLLGEDEKAGDLYKQLDQPDQARRMYRKAVDQHLNERDLIAAADVLETKIGSDDEAIEMLNSGWPHTPQAGLCLQGLFKIFQRRGDHIATSQKITDLSQASSLRTVDTDLVNILADLACEYPSPSIQRQAANCTQQIVAKALSSASRSKARHLLSTLKRLVPEDRLLGRDCEQFLQNKSVPNVTSNARRHGKKISLVHTIQLPGQGIVWQKAVWAKQSIFVVGRHENQSFAVRSSWTNAEQPVKLWRFEAPVSDAPILLSADPQDHAFVLFDVVGSSVLPNEHRFQASDLVPVTSRIGSIPSMLRSVVAATKTAQGITWLLERRNEVLTLVAVGPAGNLLSTETLPTTGSLQDMSPIVVPVPLYAEGARVYIGIDNQLLTFDKAKPVRTMEFSDPILSLAGSSPKTQRRIVLTFAQGGRLLWIDHEEITKEAFAMDMVHPIACINNGGYLIAISDTDCKIYSTQNKQLNLEAESSNLDSGAIAVLPAPQSNRFGIVTETGKINVYQLQ